MGYRIAELRKLRGLTQKQLAEKCGLSRQTIISLETDGSHIVKSSTLVKIAEALNTTVQELFVFN